MFERHSLYQLDDNRIIVGGYNNLVIINFVEKTVEERIYNEKLGGVASLMFVG